MTQRLVAEPLSQELTAEFLEAAGLLPIAVTGNEKLLVATWLPSPNERVLDDLRVLFKRELEVVQYDEEDVRSAIHAAYGPPHETAAAMLSQLAVQETASIPDAPIEDLRSQANDAPVVRLVNLLLLEALSARASDVHLEMYSTDFVVRYRIDGVLRHAPSPPLEMAPAIVSRLKIMGQLDIAERRLPQDGRVRLHLRDREVDVRVSTVPTVHGESLVLRLLDRHGASISLNEIGMAADTSSGFRAAITHQHGMVLVTGPTGSGKTTTLYAALAALNTGREKILTVEDPVEYELPGVCQVPVNARVGVTFASALRALLRQDPDIILIGEIRDAETAEIATRAALTGHLVLATLHTNDAVSALTRLTDLGVPPFLAASTVRAVLAQRLVRCLCVSCARPALATEAPAAGCSTCDGTGFRGRTGIYELLVVNEPIRNTIAQGGSVAEVRQLARAEGMRSLREDGARLVGAELTTAEEVLRVTG